MTKSRINMTCDSYVSLEDAILQNYIAETYTFPIVSVGIKEENLDDLFDDIKKRYPDADINDIEMSRTSRYIYIEYKEYFYVEMVLDYNRKVYNINIFGTSFSISKELFEFTKKYEPCGMGIYLEIDNYSIAENGSLATKKEFKELDDLMESEEEYYPYLDTDTLFRKYLLSTENILLLAGLPGVGKTRLVSLYERYLVSNPELSPTNKDNISDETYFKVAYIKNEDILAKDTFWNELANNTYNLIFLDDADNCLLPRDNEAYTQSDIDRKKFISQLLSFTDGITENNTKIIITTNRKVDDIDDAVLRRGRTFDILELQPLSFEEAKKIWLKNELHLNEFEELFKDKHDILPSEVGAEISLRKKLVDGEELGEYLLRDGISLIHSYRNKKRKMGI